MFQKLLNDKSGRCGKWGCGLGCVGLLIVILIIGSLVKYISGPGPQRVSVVPDNFPKEIKLHKADEATKILFLSGKDKNKIQQVGSVIIKLIASQFLPEEKRPKIAVTENGVKVEHEISASDIWLAIKEPMEDFDMDNIVIEWQYLDDNFNGVKTFYVASFLDEGFEIKKGAESDKIYNLTFVKDRISGDLEIELIESSGRLRVRMVVDYPST